jgi:hypothetical protein
MTMEKIKKTRITTPSAIELDRSQLEELDKLIGNLKKEIIFPGQKEDTKSRAPQLAGS